MHVLHLIQRLLKPSLLRYIQVFLLGGHRFSGQKPSVAVVNHNALQIIPVCLVKQIDPALNVLSAGGKVILFDQVIVRRIRYLPHTDQILLQILSGLFQQPPGALYRLLPGGVGKTQIEYNSKNQHNRNGNHGEAEHDRSLNSPGFQSFYIFQKSTFHFPHAPFCTWKAIRQIFS